jgi:hypothetical protein
MVYAVAGATGPVRSQNRLTAPQPYLKMQISVKRSGFSGGGNRIGNSFFNPAVNTYSLPLEVYTTHAHIEIQILKSKH